MSFIPKIKDYTDFLKIKPRDYPLLAAEIRDFLIKLSGTKEIHFSANLGIIELTIALLKKFDPRMDWMVWDTGHQTYVQKILTGRADQLPTIRTFSGIAGLMDRRESPYDHYSPGHSGNTLSVLMGLCENCRRYNVLIIGDAGFTNGITMEAINDLGARKLPIIIVLNDNGMSISEGVGGFHDFCKNLKAGDKPIAFENFFNDLGIKYIGIIDGYSFQELSNAFALGQNLVQNGPVLIHVKTIKGRGLPEAENDKTGAFHANSLKKKDGFGTVVDDFLLNLLSNDPKARVINPAMGFGAGLINLTANSHYFDTGITEEHAVSYASGMALAGLHVYVVIYSTFLQRAYDQLLHDCSRLSLKLIFLVDRADLSGGDGPSHHGIFDVGFLRSIPNTIVVTPRNGEQLQMLLEIATTADHGLWFIRYPKAVFTMDTTPNQLHQAFHWEWLIEEHNEICLLTYGPYTDVLREKINAQKINCDLVNACFITKYDESEIAKLFKHYKKIICYERIWGEQGLIHDLYCYAHMHHQNTEIIGMHYHDFLQKGETSKIDDFLGMDADAVITKIKEVNRGQRN